MLLLVGSTPSLETRAPANTAPPVTVQVFPSSADRRTPMLDRDVTELSSTPVAAYTTPSWPMPTAPTGMLTRCPVASNMLSVRAFQSLPPSVVRQTPPFGEPM